MNPSWEVEPTADSAILWVGVRLAMHKSEIEKLLTYCRQRGLAPQIAVAAAISAYLDEVKLAEPDEPRQEPDYNYTDGYPRQRSTP